MSNNGYVEHNAAGEAIDGALPNTLRKYAHHRALPYQEVGAALEAVDGSASNRAAKLCFRFVSADRSAPLRGARRGTRSICAPASGASPPSA